MRMHWLLMSLLLLNGCEQAMRNMYDQPRYDPYTASSLWPDGRSSRSLPPGVVVHSSGVLAATSSGRNVIQAPISITSVLYPRDPQGGVLVAPGPAQWQAWVQDKRENPLPLTLATLQRGRERFDIFCSPCHSVLGDGDGMVVRRGFPAAPTFHSQRLRQAPDGYLFDVISQGYGVMYPFSGSIETADRWAIVAYLRTLQLAANARIDQLPQQDRTALGKGVTQ